MQLILENAEPVAWLVVPALVSLVVGWIIVQKWAGDAEIEAFKALELVVQRVKDKNAELTAEAKDPASPGGNLITAAEKSQIRDVAYRMALADLKGPALRYVRKKGETLIKGIIGRKLDKIIGEPTMQAALALDPSASGSKESQGGKIR